MEENKPRTGGISKSEILILLLTILLTSYTILRYTSWLGEGDTARVAKAIAVMLESGELISDKLVYGNGYGYPVLATWLVHLSGLPLGVLQLIGGALLLGWVLAPAWLAYRELTLSRRGASLAILILLVQPEFVFPLLRGTHEKFTRGLMFLCLYLLLRSMRSGGIRQISRFVICFYLCAYAMICFNTFMASSFTLGLLLALGLVWLSERWATQARHEDSPLVARLVYVTTILLVIAFIFTFYIYSPAQNQISTLQNISDRIALMALQVEDTASNPYQVVSFGWISLPVYLLVSLANWILLGGSMLLWLKLSWDWLVRHKTQPSLQERLLWAFYGAFAMLGFTSIVVDISGAIAANLQHRMFPSVMMLAAPLAGAWLAKQGRSNGTKMKVVWSGASLALGCLMVLSMLKATYEPLLSNYWMFYTPAELQSIVWAEQKFPKTNFWNRTWGRAADGFSIRENGRIMENDLGIYLYYFDIQNSFVSDASRMYAQRVSKQLPIQVDSLRTYDNGCSQIYHRRPVTPYQK
jgi:hypothetical protein